MIFNLYGKLFHNCNFLFYLNVINLDKGVITAKVKTEAHAEGYIDLQRFKNGQIIFRNVKITEL